jgi:hypothetical protein
VQDPDDTARESFVHSLGGALLGGPAPGLSAGERVERLVALHRQRMLLTGLRDEAESALVAFPSADGSDWISEAQRAYAVRRSELRHELALAVHALDEALSGVSAAIATLSAGG